MKKLLPVVLIAVVAVLFIVNTKEAGKSHVEKTDFHIGVLAYLGTTEADFQNGFDKFRDFASDKDELLEDDFVNSLVKNRRIVHFYDSLMGLIMDLKSGKLDEIILPENVGQYLVKNNNSFRNVASTGILASGVSFGFREDSAGLMDEINSALGEMESDGTLDKFEAQYAEVSQDREPEPFRPIDIKDAPEIKIAVTGDMPPIDMFAGDGKPAGYNTAVLSELSRRLNKNIKFINTNAGGRSSALMSGRADVVFWYRATRSTIEGDDPFDYLFKDAPEGVILSIPYYSWENEMIIRLNDSKNLFGIFSHEKEKGKEKINGNESAK